MDSLDPIDAAIAWEGDSKEVISSFPDVPKSNLGFGLRLLQKGQQPPDYRPMGPSDRESSNCGIRTNGLGIA